jgi:hypothetical protein
MSKNLTEITYLKNEAMEIVGRGGQKGRQETDHQKWMIGTNHSTRSV